MLEVKNNTYVNLGIGIPTLVANYLHEGINVCFQSENGLLGGQLVLLHQPPVVGDLKRGQPIAGRIAADAGINYRRFTLPLIIQQGRPGRAGRH